MTKNLQRSIWAALAFFPALAAMAQCPTITCPGNIIVNSDPGTCSAVVTYAAPVGTDPCAVTTQTFNYSGSIVNWTVPAGVTLITIEAKGAEGGYNTNSTTTAGRGAGMKGDFTVVPGSMLKILVGQQPTNSAGNGGGGGSFVTDASNNPLIVAGGGGGSSQGADSPAKDGNITTTGGAGAGAGGVGGTAGSGGSIGSSGFQAGAGAGLLTNGADGWTSGTGGLAFVNGGAGSAANAPANGGFGGGGSGSSYVVGGGGGGYSGGGSGGNSTAGVGGGGGSFNAGTNQVNTGGANTGDGVVTIMYTSGVVAVTTQTAGLPSGAAFPAGTTTVTYTVDNGLGDTSSCSFTVTVTDNELPVPDAASLPSATDECSVTLTAPTATDNCAGTLTGTTTDPLTYTAQGSYSVVWTFNDGNGNTGTQTQSVTIADVTAPVPDAAALSDVMASCSAAVTTIPTATDNCAGAITATTTDPLTYTTEGTYTITWTFDDGHGNTSTQTQNVIVDDTTAPVADNAALTDVTGQCFANVSAVPTATDNCAGALTGTTTDPLSYFAAGTYVVTWTYDDGNGNMSTQTQNVIVTGVDTAVTVSGPLFTANAGGEVYAWLDCGSNTLVAGETSQSFTASIDGSYALVITQAGCTDTSACYSVLHIGISENNAATDISIYPNPTTGMVTIRSNTATGTIRVTDMLGRIVVSQQVQDKNTTIDLSSFDNGVFYISIETGSFKKVSKLIKK